MPFLNSKVYFDGSHFIAIPYVPNLAKKSKKITPEEVVYLDTENQIIPKENLEDIKQDFKQEEKQLSLEDLTLPKQPEKPTLKRQITLKDYFNELYKKYALERLKTRKKLIVEAMLPLFSDKQACYDFVNANVARKIRNLIARRIRLARKANLANFNYFCTFTYDNEKHTEDSFKKKLKTVLRNFCYRKGWKYLGVWERAPKTNRLHFHGLFHIPDNALPGKLSPNRDYDTRAKKMRITYQSSFFNKKFGRSDFKVVKPQELGSALGYLVKYLEKTDEKIVYSKNLPQFILADILDKDIVCRTGTEDKKLLLFDDFLCVSEGVIMGKAGSKTFEQMPTSN